MRRPQQAGPRRARPGRLCRPGPWPLLVMPLVLALCQAAPARATLAAPSCELAGQPVDPALPASLKGRSGWMRCMQGEQLLREQEVHNGRLSGAVRHYRNGQLSREQFLNERGNLQGRSREWGANGQLLREGSYENGAFAGLVRSFHPDGSLQRASFYGPEGEMAYAEFTRNKALRSLRCADRPLLAPAADDARLCGFGSRPSQVSFLAESGVLRARATFLNGTRVRYETFQDTGLPATQEEITAAGRIERIFGADGARRREVLWTLRNGPAQREREQEFSSAGTLTRERLWLRGELVSEQTFHLNGQPRSLARYAGSGPARTLEIEDFYDNGMPASRASYVETGRYAPTPVGTHRRYDRQGRQVGETVYDSRGRILRERTWDGGGAPRGSEGTDLGDAGEDGARRAQLAR